MKRTYTSGITDDVKFFIGREIEKTPAFGMKTLFVVGLQPIEQIIVNAYDNDCDHIYFGANQSFPYLNANDAAGWQPWESMIRDCLARGDYWCTLDLDINQAEGLLESGLTEYRRFIPQISVKLPCLQQLGYNATIKIDDKGFEETNPGVWCLPLTELTRREYFTNWDEYTKDEIIK
jgi:hypothetical protein